MNSGFRPAAQPSNLLLCSIYSDIHSDHSEDQPHEHTLDLLCVDVGRTLHYYSSPHTDTVCSSAVCPPKTSKHLAQETTETNSSMGILYPVK